MISRESHGEKRCRSIASSTDEQCKNNRFPGSRYCWIHFEKRTPVLVSFLVSAMVAAGVVIYSNLTEPKPDLHIRGVTPVHLVDDVHSGVEFRQHQLAMIARVENRGDTPGSITNALVSGCVRVEPLLAELTLPEEERLPSGTPMDSLFQRHEHSVMAIRLKGMIRSDSNNIEPKGNGYIGILFGLRVGRSGADAVVPGSVSLSGECDELLTPSSDPSIMHLFQSFRVHYDNPEDIANEFRSGDLLVHLMTSDGDSKLVTPTKLKMLRTITWRNWQTVDLSQLYELNYTGAR